METPVPTPTAAPPVEVCFPLAGYSATDLPAILSQVFIPPAPGKDDGHHGIDLASYTSGRMSIGVPVQAALPGKVAAIIHNRPPYGDAILVETTIAQVPVHFVETNKITSEQSLYLLYAHLQNMPALQVGQDIPCGMLLGETGLTGYTGGPHLHLETRSGPPGVTFESMAFYETSITPAESKNYTTWRMSGLFTLHDPLPLLQAMTIP